MELITSTKYTSTEHQHYFMPVFRSTFEFDNKTWRVDHVIVDRQGVWITAERQTKSGRDYVRCHGRAINATDLPVDVAAEIGLALAALLSPVIAEAVAVEAPAPARKRLSSVRLIELARGISYDHRQLPFPARVDLSHDLAEREGITLEHARTLVEAACSGLPVTISWKRDVLPGVADRATGVALVLRISSGRLRLRCWGFEHNVFISDLLSVEVPQTKWETRNPEPKTAPVAVEPERTASIELPGGSELVLAVARGDKLSTERPGNAGLSNESLKLFLDYARDAGNWGGTPLVGGNVDGSYEANGYLLHLKQAGLLTTDRDGRDVWIYFTQKGYDFAAEHGVTIPVR